VLFPPSLEISKSLSGVILGIFMFCWLSAVLDSIATLVFVVLFSVGAVPDPMLLDAMLVLFLFASFLVHSGVLRCLSPSLVREH
jgi:hypothetical protein